MFRNLFALYSVVFFAIMITRIDAGWEELLADVAIKGGNEILHKMQTFCLNGQESCGIKFFDFSNQYCCYSNKDSAFSIPKCCNVFDFVFLGGRYNDNNFLYAVFVYPRPVNLFILGIIVLLVWVLMMLLICKCCLSCVNGLVECCMPAPTYSIVRSSEFNQNKIL